MRVKAVIAYDGSKFQGFQQQKSTNNTIHTTLHNALLSLGIDSKPIGSGRTDTNVHATGQVVSFDLPAHWQDLPSLKKRLNNKLKYIHIKHISKVDDNFHARFSAKKRVYRYIFKSTRPHIFERDYIAYLKLKDSNKLQEALSLFVGRYDFSLFCKTGSEVKDHIKEIYDTKYIQRGDYHYIYFQANGYLRAQVRMMIDAAIKVANGKLTLNQLKEQIDDITKYTHTLAPAEGLYLARVIY